jgi:solute carrier family 25 phosphate transporter 3
MQVDPNLSDKSFLRAAREITKNEGMSALWAGLGPTAWGYLFEGAVKFGVYEVLKPVFKSYLSRVAAVTSLTILNSQILAFLLCATVSGFAASLMLTPMEALRIRLVSEPNFAPGGWLEGGHKMLKQEGVSGLAKGVKPMIMKQVPYTVTKNVSFDIITRFLYSVMRAQGMAFTAASTFTVPLVSAAIASVLACISSQPGDMVLSLVNAHEGDQRSTEVYKSILRSERGVRGFFVGFRTRLLHVGIIVTLQLLIYDYVKRLCGIAATGSL